MTAEPVEVKATYVAAELVRIEFCNSHLMSDHPVTMGGGGKGPSPGVMMLSALTSAGVLAVQKKAKQDGGKVLAVRAAATARYDRETVSGPMPALVTTGVIRQRLDLLTDLGADIPALTAAFNENGIARSLRDGIELEEHVRLEPANGARPAARPRNEVLWAGDKAMSVLDSGVIVAGTLAPKWAAIATAPDAERAMVDFSRNMLPVSAAAGGPDGPSPTELLAAGLAACTTIYVARNAAFHGIVLNSVEVTVRADREAGDGQQIRHMVKDTVVTGDISAADFERVKFFADYCAIGNSLIRGIEIDTDLNISSEALGDSPTPRALDLPPPDDPACVDGTCCIP